jgi:hypothetical protein
MSDKNRRVFNINIDTGEAINMLKDKWGVAKDDLLSSPPVVDLLKKWQSTTMVRDIKEALASLIESQESPAPASCSGIKSVARIPGECVELDDGRRFTRSDDGKWKFGSVKVEEEFEEKLEAMRTDWKLDLKRVLDTMPHLATKYTKAYNDGSGIRL